MLPETKGLIEGRIVDLTESYIRNTHCQGAISQAYSLPLHFGPKNVQVYKGKDKNYKIERLYEGGVGQ